MTGSVYGGDSRMYILPAPIHGSNLPAGMCQTSQYSHFAIGWNFVSVANGSSYTNMECLELLVRLKTLRETPIAQPSFQLIQPQVTQPQVILPQSVCRPKTKKQLKCK